MSNMEHRSAEEGNKQVLQRQPKRRCCQLTARRREEGWNNQPLRALGRSRLQLSLGTEVKRRRDCQKQLRCGYRSRSRWHWGTLSG